MARTPKHKLAKRPAEVYSFARYKKNKVRRIENHLMRTLRGKMVGVNDVQSSEALARVKSMTSFGPKRHTNSR